MIIDITTPTSIEAAQAEADATKAQLLADATLKRAEAEQMLPTMVYVGERRMTTIRIPAGEAAIDPLTGSVTMAVDLDYLKRLLKDGGLALCHARQHSMQIAQRDARGRRRTDFGRLA